MADETTVVHLLRHGEVHNPHGIVYGRLPGYLLSDEGVIMAKAAARHLANRDVAALFSSPLERTRQTAQELADTFGIGVRVEDRLIEPTIHFQGYRFRVGGGSLRHPAHWPKLRNPFRPSWGEPYSQIASRMLAAVAVARDAARGREAVCVTHQLPIWVVRRAVEGRPLWHLPNCRQCALASITSLTYVGERIVSVNYSEPAGPEARSAAGA